MAEGDRQMKPMTRQQALDKLASAPFGRVVFTEHAMPARRRLLVNESASLSSSRLVTRLSNPHACPVRLSSS